MEPMELSRRGNAGYHVFYLCTSGPYKKLYFKSVQNIREAGFCRGDVQLCNRRISRLVTSVKKAAKIVG